VQRSRDRPVRLHGGNEIVTKIFTREKNMKFTNVKRAGISAAIILAFCSLCAYAEEKQDEPYMNKDQVNGTVDETKGKVKEVTGKILDDKRMETEGKIQKNLGKVQKGVGNIKEDIKKDN
jgi:uncharacterized protein YjbJ (UPF0337 family)